MPLNEPSLVRDPDIRGLCDVLQQTPLVVTGDPPLPDIFPPDCAPVLVIPEGVVVVSDGTVASVLNVRSFP